MTDYIPTIHEADAATLRLPAPVPKPTSLTGQTESSVTLWTSPDGLTEMGVWECSPGTFTAFRDGYDEFANILFGAVTMTTDEGEKSELGPGSVIVTPSGWKGTWTVHETVRKVWVTRSLS
jgi:uncharacterized cupin superfamily protein